MWRSPRHRVLSGGAPMNPADLIQQLQDGLDGVTPGPWKQFRRNGVNEVQHGRSNVPVVAWSGFDDSSRPEHEHAANAAHIARCHPDNIRALLDSLASKDTALS